VDTHILLEHRSGRDRQLCRRSGSLGRVGESLQSITREELTRVHAYERGERHDDRECQGSGPREAARETRGGVQVVRESERRDLDRQHDPKGP